MPGMRLAPVTTAIDMGLGRPRLRRGTVIFTKTAESVVAIENLEIQ